MTMTFKRTARVLSTMLTVSLLTLSARAEVVSSSDRHFVLRHEGHSARSVDEMWQRLTQPATWWHPEHTFSGDAANLSLEPHAGGLWSETWDGGSVAHGRVLTVHEGKVLRMDAPFGPLQELGAYTVWTITIEAGESGGSVVVFNEVSNAAPNSNMEKMAQAVDFVKTEAMARLIAP
ncbi:MAG: hypothetical protein AAF417_00670 [Pseudomonadota bacterium]